MAQKFLTGIDVTGNSTFSGNVTASSGTGHFSNVNSSSYQLNGTYVMDSSRNLVNIGTIASGAITVSGGALSISGDGSNAATLTESSAGILTIATVDDFKIDAGGDISLDADGGDID